MKEFYKIAGWSVGILGLLVLIFMKSCKNSMAEDNSRYTVSSSSKLAKETGAFVTPVVVSPQSFMWHGNAVTIDDAWVERECQVHYTLLFFRRDEFFDEYKLVVVPHYSPEVEALDLGFAADSNHTFQRHSHGFGISYELVYDLGEAIPKNLSVVVLDKRVPVDTLKLIVKEF